MLHRVNQQLTVENVDIQMVRALCKISIQNGDQVIFAFGFGLAKSVRDNREGVGDTILADIAVRNLRNRVEGCKCTVFIPSVHRVGTGCERFADFASVRSWAGLLAVHDVGSDGQCRQGMFCIAVERMLFQLIREEGNCLNRQIVHTVIVIAVFGEIAFDGKINCNAGMVADRFDLGKLDCRQRVCRNRKPGHTKRHQTLDMGIMQRHLGCFISIFIVHEVDDVDRVDIQSGNVGKNLLIVGHNLVKIQDIIRNRLDTGHNFSAFQLVYAAVDRIQQRFCHIRTSAKKLHLLADRHCRYTAGDRVVIAIDRTHHVIILVLNRVSRNRHLRTVTLEVFGQLFAPEYRQVGFGGGAEVGEGMQITVRVFGNQRLTVDTDAADRLGDPGGVTAKQLVIFRSTQMTDQAQFNDKLINQFLCTFFGQSAVFQITLDVDIQEGGSPAEGSCGTVVFLDTGKVSHIQILYRLLSIFSRCRNIHAVTGSHRLHLIQCANLLADLFPQTDEFFGHRAVQLAKIFLFLLLEVIDTVQRNTAVVADDTAAAVSIRQAGQETRMTGSANPFGISVKYTLIMGFTVFMELLFDIGVEGIAVLFEAGLCHPKTAVQVDNPFERCISLQADDHFVVLVDIAGGKVVNPRNDIGFNINDAFFDLLDDQCVALFPDLCSLFAHTCEEGFIPFIQGIVFLNKTADIDLIHPDARCKALPSGIFQYILIHLYIHPFKVTS